MDYFKIYYKGEVVAEGSGDKLRVIGAARAMVGDVPMVGEVIHEDGSVGGFFVGRAPIDLGM